MACPTCNKKHPGKAKRGEPHPEVLSIEVAVTHGTVTCDPFGYRLLIESNTDGSWAVSSDGYSLEGAEDEVCQVAGSVLEDMGFNEPEVKIS